MNNSPEQETESAAKDRIEYESRRALVDSAKEVLDQWPNQEKGRGYLLLCFSEKHHSIIGDANIEMISFALSALKEQMIKQTLESLSSAIGLHQKPN